MKLLGLLRRHATAVWMGTFVLVMLGVVCALDMPSGIYPEVEFPRIVVVAKTGGAPPEVVSTSVTRPLEQSVGSVLGLTGVRSKTIRGATEISLQFSPETDMWRALQMVESRVSETRAELPADAEIIVERVTTGSFPIVTLNVAGAIDPRELRELARYVVQPALVSVPGVGRVEVLGGDVRELEVILDPEALPALGLNPEDLATKVRASLGLFAVGRVLQGQSLITVLADNEARSLQALRELPISTTVQGHQVLLGDVAEVVDGAEDRTQRIGGPAGNTVNISIARAPGASTPVVVERALSAIASIRPVLPPGVTITPVYDQAELVQDAMNGVRDAILLGIVLCAAVIALFLRSFRVGVQAALAVPITLALTFVCMKLGQQTLNLMSLGGMAVAIGLVVDDAIVIVEAISRARELGKDAQTAAIEGTLELAPAVIGTTLTTVVVLVPLLFLHGVVGDFFRALAFTLTAAVALSLPVALGLIPLAAGGLAPPRVVQSRAPNRLVAVYERLSKKGRSKPGLALTFLGASAVVGAFVLPRVERGFLPQVDEGAFVLDYFLPAGTSIETTEHFARALEAELRATPEVLTFSRRLGTELGPAAATELNRGDIMVRLRKARERSTSDIEADLRQRVETKLPEVRTEFMQVLQDVLNDLSGSPRPLEVKLLGPEPRVLNELGEKLASRLEGVHGLVDVYSGHERDVTELHFHPDSSALARLGATNEGFSAQLSAALQGSIAGAVRRGDRLVNLRVRYPNSIRFDPARVLDLPFNAGAKTLTLRAIAEPQLVHAAPELMHDALEPMVAVTADHEGGDLALIGHEIQAAITELKLPQGYRAVVAGEIAQEQRTVRELGMVAAFAGLLVLSVLSAQFRRVRLALLVLLMVPFALVGALLGLWLTSTPLNASSLMGGVLLVGLVVKNGVLLLEEAEKRFDRGDSAEQATSEATSRRLRPILMTTTATLAGLLPLALGIGAGAELQQPLAITVMFGLVSSTLSTLGFLPSFAALLLRRSRAS
jgi:CzcA family heavy metal efflux pump